MYILLLHLHREKNVSSFSISIIILSIYFVFILTTLFLYNSYVTPKTSTNRHQTVSFSVNYATMTVSTDTVRNLGHISENVSIIFFRGHGDFNNGWVQCPHTWQICNGKTFGSKDYKQVCNPVLLLS